MLVEAVVVCCAVAAFVFALGVSVLLWLVAPAMRRDDRRWDE
jgi:hypothetical protein